MTDILSFVLGAEICGLIILSVGWIDVIVLKKPHFETKTEWGAYVLYTAWECMFFISGILLGVILK
jgi:hypothetical protein